MEEAASYRAEKYRVRENLLKYTRRAFGMLPSIEKPRILDIGCGSGIPTIELVRLSDGWVTGIDIDEESLGELSRRAETEGLADRVITINCSLTEMGFPDESFDIIWSEGSIFVIGFEKGLREWKRLLKPGGYMVIHDEEGNLDEKLQTAKTCGYEMLDYILLDKNTWRQEYYAPLKQLVEKTIIAYDDNEEIRRMVENDRSEIEWFDNNPGQSSSVIFVMKMIGCFSS